MTKMTKKALYKTVVGLYWNCRETEKVQTHKFTENFILSVFPVRYAPTECVYEIKVDEKKIGIFGKAKDAVDFIYANVA